MALTRIDSYLVDLNSPGGITFDDQAGTPTFKVDAVNHRVGIGTATPLVPLDVHGISHFTGKIGIGTTDPQGSLHIYRQDTVSGLETHTDFILENPGAGNARFFLKTLANNRNWEFFADDSDGAFGIYDGVAAARRFTILPDGNVGIGTTTPGYTLDVNGDVNVASGSNYFINGTQISTANVTENASYLYYTDTRSRNAISVTDSGGDGSLSYDSGTGVITYTGPSASETRAHFSAGTGVSIASGQISIGQPVGSSDNVSFADGVFSGNVGIGTTDPSVPLQVSDGNVVSSSLITSDYIIISAQDAAPGFSIVSSNDISGGGRGVFKATRSRGTLENPTAAANNDAVFSLLGAVYDGASVLATAQIQLDVDGAVSTGVAPQRISFWTGTTNTRTEKMRISSDGNVGIGTTNPATSFDVYKQAGGTTGGQISIRNDASAANTEVGIHLCPNSGGVVRAASIYSTQETLGNFANLRFFTANGDTPAERLRITSSGNVGIGTTNPSHKLEILGRAWFKPNSDGSNAIALSLGSYNNSNQPFYDIITNDATTDLVTHRINRFTGTWDFSRTSPTGDQSAIQLVSNFNNGSDIYILDQNTTSKIRLSAYTNSYFNGGNVGIGTTNPANKLHVDGGVYFNNTISTTGTFALRSNLVIDNTDADNVFNTYLNTTITDNGTTTADREHGGIRNTITSNATGGDTSNEHRVWGIWNDINVGGDSDSVYGTYNDVRLAHTSGTITEARGGTSIVQLASSGDISNLYAVYGLAQPTSGCTGSINNVVGVLGRVNVSAGTGSPSVLNVYGVYSNIDNDNNATNTGITALFYGKYDKTTNLNNPQGVYIEGDDIKNYFAGSVGIGTTNPTCKLTVEGVGHIVRMGNSSNSDWIDIDVGTANHPAIVCPSTTDVLELRSFGGVQVAFDSNNNSAGEYFRVINNGLGLGGSELLRLDEGGNFRINQSVPEWTNSTFHPIIRWDFKSGPGDMMYIASGGNTSIADQMALVISDGHGVKIGRSGWDGTDTDIDSSNEFFRITNAGNVGVGTTNPTSKLDVIGGVLGTEINSRNRIARFQNYALSNQLNLDILSRRTSTTGTTWPYSETRIEYNVDNNSNKRIWISFFNPSTDTTVNAIRFGEQEDTEWMRIKDGNVGIGTSSPQERLQVDGGNGIISGNLALGTTDLTTTDLNYNRKLKISGTGPAVYLEETDTSQSYAISATGGRLNFRDATASTTRIALTSAGNVGIGTVDPSYKLHVVGDINFTGTLNQNGVPFSPAGENLSPVNIQEFTSSGTWTKPSGAKMVYVEVIGGGGGGGGGAKLAAPQTLNSVGGGGGAAGMALRRWILASDLGSTVTVTVGAGGAGAAAVTTANTNGNSGVNGGNSSFGTLVYANGGSFGSRSRKQIGGQGGAGRALSANAVANTYLGAAGGGSGVSGAADGGGPGYYGWEGPGGGGAGGGLRGSDGFQRAGGEGGGGFVAFDSSRWNQSLGGGGAAGSGGNGGNGAAPGDGGGGGGSGNTVSGGNGGAGVFPGGGGGGGGTTNTGASSGAGGAGAGGVVRVYTYF